MALTKDLTTLDLENLKVKSNLDTRFQSLVCDDMKKQFLAI